MYTHQATPSGPITTKNATRSTIPPILTPASPATVNKTAPLMPGSSLVPPISVNKTWVLPPKPKPGRKPAVDTPPTKRKAQNREAQRAFRERRAAKVGELEDEMKKLEDEDAREQEVLRQRIQQLEINVGEYSNLVVVLRERFNEMQMAYGRERQLREQAELMLEDLKKAMMGGSEAIALPPKRTDQSRDLGEQSNEVTGGFENDDINQVPLTCGKCSNDTRCQCIEEAFEMGNLDDGSMTPTVKRPISPLSSADNKRLRYNDQTQNEQEVDFTAQFTSRQPPPLTTSASTSSSTAAIAAPDPCGFCQEGSLCLCAELAKDKSRYPNPQPPAPLPSDADSEYTGKSNSDPCANGPGTCAQCRSNPTSTLFCKTVAANRSAFTDDRSQSDNIPCSSTPSEGLTITCADAFTTLSRHPRFSTATNELNEWVPQLRSVAKPSGMPERTAFDIEAASVMSVLKLFDRRFGSQNTELDRDKEGKPFNQQDGSAIAGSVNAETSIEYENDNIER